MSNEKKFKLILEILEGLTWRTWFYMPLKGRAERRNIRRLYK